MEYRFNANNNAVSLETALFSLSKNFQYASVSDIIKETGVFLWSNGEKMQEVKRSSWI